MTDETKGDGMTLSDKDKATLRELSEMYKSEGFGSPDYQEWDRLTHPYSIDLLLAEIDSLKAAQSAMRVDEAKLAEAVACVETHLSRMNRYYHEKVAWQVIKDHLAAIGGKS